MFAAIASIGKKAIDEQKEVGAQAQGQAQGMMQQSQQQLTGMNNFDYKSMPSFRDFTNFQ
jgi:hypothetical protein